MGRKDDLYQDEYEPAGLRWMSIAVVMLAVSGFVALAWYAYNAGQSNMRVEDVLIVEAEDTPYRVEPTERGGAEFKHKDKEIYETLDPKPKKVETAKVLPQPEEPKRPELKETPKQVEKTAPVAPKPDTATVTSYISPIPEPEETAKLKKPDPFDPKPEPKQAPAPKPAEPIAVDPIVKAVEQADKAAENVKGHTVQLGAFKSEQEAQDNWAKIRRSHLDLLDTHSHMIVKADLGAKGVYYRLRVTGLESKDAGLGLCKLLSKRSQPCFYSGKN